MSIKRSKWNFRAIRDSDKRTTIISHLSTALYLSRKRLETSSYQFKSIVNCADLDQAESRYLLVGKSLGEIAIHDVSHGDHGEQDQFKLLGRNKPETMHSSIQNIQWYPVDSGLFTSSELDDSLCVWDASTFRKADRFRLKSEICHHSMSPVAANHALIAAALRNGQIVLCDLRSGSSSHCLHGHVGPVKCVDWDPLCQYNLVSGGCDGIIRVWDTRASKSCRRMVRPPTQKGRRGGKVLKDEHQAIGCLLYTPNGTQLTAFRENSKVEVWNTVSWCRKVLKWNFRYNFNYPGFPMCTSRHTYPDLLYLPSDNNIYVMDMISGKICNILTAHCDNIYGLVYNSRYEHLHSYGRDGNFLTWEPSLTDIAEQSLAAAKLRRDSWSDDDI